MQIFNFHNLSFSRLLITLLTILLSLAVAGSPLAAGDSAKQKSFASPEEAVKSLHDAVQQSDDKALSTILGSASKRIIKSGDPVADKADREQFLRLYAAKNRLDKKGGQSAILYIGNDDFPFPLPLVLKKRGWVFDTRAGKKELLTRRIGKNELAVMDVMHAYLDAQREYARKDHDSNGVLEFAQKLGSSPGKQDGLYWETMGTEELSPFGPLVALADFEGYGRQFIASDPEPFHGYYFKILTQQGESAEGGAFNYVVNGKMVLGFALLAYPTGYRSSGVMTFIVNQSGSIYQKDLGRESSRIARQMTSFDPDSSWKKVE